MFPLEPVSPATTPRRIPSLTWWYVQALGGAAAIERITSRQEKGTATVGGRAINVEVFEQDPNQQAVVRHLPAGDSLEVFNGREGWSSMPGRSIRDLNGADLDAVQMDADLHFPLHMRQTFGDCGWNIRKRSQTMMPTSFPA